MTSKNSMPTDPGFEFLMNSLLASFFAGSTATKLLLHRN
jgi:hypothetical protein